MKRKKITFEELSIIVLILIFLIGVTLIFYNYTMKMINSNPCYDVYELKNNITCKDISMSGERFFDCSDGFIHINEAYRIKADCIFWNNNEGVGK